MYIKNNNVYFNALVSDFLLSTFMQFYIYIPWFIPA